MEMLISLEVVNNSLPSGALTKGVQLIIYYHAAQLTKMRLSKLLKYKARVEGNVESPPASQI